MPSTWEVLSNCPLPALSQVSGTGTLTVEYHVVVLEVLPLLIPLGVLVQHDAQGLPVEVGGTAGEQQLGSHGAHRHWEGAAGKPKPRGHGDPVLI